MAAYVYMHASKICFCPNGVSCHSAAFIALSVNIEKDPAHDFVSVYTYILCLCKYVYI